MSQFDTDHAKLGRSWADTRYPNNDRRREKKTMPTPADLARSLIRVGGTADATDQALLANRLAVFTIPILTQLTENGTTVVVCRGSVTEYLTQLRGIVPRGWPADMTWDSVPGIFYPETNEVVVAIVGHGTPAGPRIPQKGEGQGSADVVLHESAHGLDMGGGSPFWSAGQAFIAARNVDLGKLPNYERQPSPAGEEETFAESAARFFTGQDAAMPDLQAYWASISQQFEEKPEFMAELRTERRPPLLKDETGKTIGTASMSADGTITLQLRATGHGARGDAQVIYRPDHPRYEHILQHLGELRPNEHKHIPPFPVEP
jgi:hypothetical protein